MRSSNDDKLSRSAQVSPITQPNEPMAVVYVVVTLPMLVVLIVVEYFAVVFMVVKANEVVVEFDKLRTFAGA